MRRRSRSPVRPPHPVVACVLALALSLAWPSAALAQSVSVRGAVDCARWRLDRSMESFGARLAEMWLLGYLSGLGVGRQADALKGGASPVVFGEIDAWCAQHPEASVDDAADALFEWRGRERGR